MVGGSAASVLGAVAFGLAALAPTGDLLWRLVRGGPSDAPVAKPAVEAFFEQCAALAPGKPCPPTPPEVIVKEAPLQWSLLGVAFVIGLVFGTGAGACLCRFRAQKLEKKVEKLQVRTRDLARLRAENVRLRKAGAISV